MITTNAEVVDTGLPLLRRTNTHASSIGRPTKRKTLSTTAAVRSPCRRSWVIRSPPQAGQFHPVSALNGHGKKTKLVLCGLPKPTYARLPTNTAPVPTAPSNRLLGGGLSAIAERATLWIADLVGENQNGVDDPPDYGTETARDQPDNELGDAQTRIAEVNTADADQAE